jgi:Na+/H+ antiporter NhaD/arsenite permease-like protein
LVLLGIAVLPLAWPKIWERNANKAIFAASIAAPTAFYLATVDHHLLIHALTEYVQFIVLIGSLYVVTGGIVVRGDLRTSALANTATLALGSTLASFIGTTGASMLLIRPYLRNNRGRTKIRHLPIFFIFAVSNAGGLLTPLGDPPLFLGYLRQVPFAWTFRLWPEWLFVNAAIIAIFYAIDRRAFATDTFVDQPPTRITVAGAHNLVFLAAIVGAVAFLPVVVRELAMIAAAVTSMAKTPKPLRTENAFTFHPLHEVAILFVAIFVTMQPALIILGEMGPRLGLSEPWHFFVASGTLSSFLDNAPTYATFFEVARSIGPAAGPLVGASGVAEPLLIGLSLGSVLMGANTYIGNGPNFMVKAIADESGFHTPTFFGYMAWSVGILGPLWILVAVLFL